MLTVRAFDNNTKLARLGEGCDDALNSLCQADVIEAGHDQRSGRLLEEQIVRRTALAERKIAVAEAQASAEVKAAAADLAAQAAEAVLATRIAGAKSDPLIDEGLKGLAGRFQ